jgi:beta-galactosidase
VDLLINGASVGRKPAGAVSKNKVLFEVPYQPGTIEAIGYVDGKETHRTSLKTASDPVALRLTPDRAVLDHEFGDLAYVTVEVVDEDGAVVKYAADEIAFEITGVGDLVAIGTANPVSEELYVGTSRTAYQGRLMAVVCTIGHEGDIVLKASADGLTTAETRIRAK